MNKQRSKFSEYWITGWALLVLSGISWGLLPFLGYRAVGFIFIIGVVALGLFASLGPILLAAVLSTLIWNYFFIPPRLTFYIHAPEDIMMCVTYLCVAILIGILTNRLKRNEAALREKEEQSKATRELEESEKLHQAIFNSLSHELKTPLTTIIGLATILEDGSTINHKTQIQLAHGINQESQRLNRVIENLLDMSRLNTGKLKLNRDWHDVNDLIRSSVHRLSSLTSSHQIIVDAPNTLPLVKIDFALFETALSNIILNAIKYSPAGSQVKIEASTQNEKLYFTIEDEGPGVPETEISKIFMKFYRVPGTPSGGMGLGLSIASSIIEAHGGTIKAMNSENKTGAKFTIELILEEAPTLPAEIVDVATEGIL